MGTVTVLRAASARSSASASASLAAGGRVDATGSRSRITSGTAASATASRDSAPIAASMRSSSCGRGPMCRSTNGWPCSRSKRDGRFTGASEVTD